MVQGRGRGEIGHFKERILKKIVSREGGKGKGLTKKREMGGGVIESKMVMVNG